MWHVCPDRFACFPVQPLTASCCTTEDILHCCLTAAGWKASFRSSDEQSRDAAAGVRFHIQQLLWPDLLTFASVTSHHKSGLTLFKVTWLNIKHSHKDEGFKVIFHSSQIDQPDKSKISINNPSSGHLRRVQAQLGRRRRGEDTGDRWGLSERRQEGRTTDGEERIRPRKDQTSDSNWSCDSNRPYSGSTDPSQRRLDGCSRSDRFHPL